MYIVRGRYALWKKITSFVRRSCGLEKCEIIALINAETQARNPTAVSGYLVFKFRTQYMAMRVRRDIRGKGSTGENKTDKIRTFGRRSRASASRVV